MGTLADDYLAGSPKGRSLVQEPRTDLRVPRATRPDRTLAGFRSCGSTPHAVPPFPHSIHPRHRRLDGFAYVSRLQAGRELCADRRRPWADLDWDHGAAGDRLFLAGLDASQLRAAEGLRIMPA